MIYKYVEERKDSKPIEHYIDENLTSGKVNQKVSIYLAGTCEGALGTAWRRKVEKQITKYYGDSFEFTFINPKEPNVPVDDNKVSFDKIQWEQDKMKDSDFIFLYFDPNSKSIPSLLTYVQYVSDPKLITLSYSNYFMQDYLNILAELSDTNIHTDINRAVVDFGYKLEDKFGDTNKPLPF